MMMVDNFFFSLDFEIETSEKLIKLDILDSMKNKNNIAMKTEMMKMEMIMMLKSTNLQMMKF